MTVKCVVWDLDGTVWPGVAIERSTRELPEPFPRALAAMAALEERGVVNSVASRTDPSMAELLAADPGLANRFVVPQLSWGDKDQAIRRIVDELGISPSATVFVDDNPFERAQVAALLPEVRVLAPDELYAQLDAGTLVPAPATEEARRRVDRYREEQARRAAEQEFTGSREEFLRACGMVLTVGTAGPADLPRIGELTERTHRFNTTGEQWPLERLAGLIDDPRWFVPVARLTDRFGEYGLISTALVERGAGTGPDRAVDAAPGGDGHPDWRLRLFMSSCRAAGRDVPVAVLGWIMREARAAGAARLLVDIRTDLANLELRVLLRRAGFGRVAVTGEHALLLGRDLTGELPVVPHLRLSTEQDRTIERTGAVTEHDRTVAQDRVVR
ncbi:hypothetical protein [Micromonospora echinofusca]|uniref:FkbH-like protein n=1 Tax=Micromonospora echinofusca TaxID=47858 RepID=A0ABS3VV97_MICEH|nr:hypothetical protein [Micromonospora echinofusca]MBO4208477.1 FkbH-like protein [Micromonospora echinofusca]